MVAETALVFVLLLLLLLLLCNSASRPALSVLAAHSISRLRRSSPGPRTPVPLLLFLLFDALPLLLFLSLASTGPLSRCNPASNAATSVPARTRLFFAVAAISWTLAVSWVIVD